MKTKRVFGFIHEIISVLAPHYPELALRLFLHAATVRAAIRHACLPSFCAIRSPAISKLYITDAHNDCYARMQVADKTNYEAISYEFIAQAFVIYEDEISDSKAQFNGPYCRSSRICQLVISCCSDTSIPLLFCFVTAVTLIAATLQSFQHLGEENFETLVTKTTLYSAKLLKKPDQCRAVYNCANLFWAVCASNLRVWART